MARFTLNRRHLTVTSDLSTPLLSVIRDRPGLEGKSSVAAWLNVTCAPYISIANSLATAGLPYLFTEDWNVKSIGAVEGDVQARAASAITASTCLGTAARSRAQALEQRSETGLSERRGWSYKRSAVITLPFQLI